MRPLTGDVKKQAPCSIYLNRITAPAVIMLFIKKSLSHQMNNK